MNGRIYDPVLGQFMQADNYIQTPEDYIGYDRYNYVRGNPFKYTDPSGEWGNEWQMMLNERYTLAERDALKYRWTERLMPQFELEQELARQFAEGVENEMNQWLSEMAMFHAAWGYAIALNDAMQRFAEAGMRSGGNNSTNPESSTDDATEETTITMTIQREKETKHSTLSSWEVEGTDLSGKILEPGGPSSTTADDGKRINAGKFGIEYRYSVHYDKFMLFLTGVNGKTGIILHTGNYPSNTIGCLVIGSYSGYGYDPNWSRSTGRHYKVYDSVHTYDLLFDYFKNIGFKNVRINIYEIP